jgi:hypothetical protein
MTLSIDNADLRAIMMASFWWGYSVVADVAVFWRLVLFAMFPRLIDDRPVLTVRLLIAELTDLCAFPATCPRDPFDPFDPFDPLVGRIRFAT